MTQESKRLAIRQLDNILSKFKGNGSIIPLPKGWIRAIRAALGMSARQLGKRADMTQAAVAQIEKSEAAGKASISTMRKMAKALDCTFVYALVPNTSLEAFLKRRITEHAKQKVLSTAHSMSLESQGITDEETQKQIDMLAETILATFPRNIWDQDGS